MQRSNPEILARYNCSRWKKLKAYKRKLNPFCEECLKNGIYKPSYIVHHITWIDETNYNDDNIFYNINNLESLCLECHNKIHFEKERGYLFDDFGNLISKKPPTSTNSSI